MAAKRSAQYPYQWHDGTWHSTPTAPPRVNPVASINPPKPVNVKPPKPSVPKVAPVMATTSAQALPPDAIYQDDVALAEQRRAQTETALRGNRRGQLASTGYTETNIDPDTGVGTLAFNPHDPFSKAALLKRTYDASRARTAQQMGSGGGLYSGAFQQAQDMGNRAQLQGEDALQRSLFSFLGQNTAATKQAPIDEQFAGIKADSARMGRLDQNSLYDPSEASPVVKRPVVKKPVVKPKGGIGKAVKVTQKPKSAPLTAKPGGKKVVTTTKTKPKGKVVTHTRSVKRP